MYPWKLPRVNFTFEKSVTHKKVACPWATANCPCVKSLVWPHLMSRCVRFEDILENKRRSFQSEGENFLGTSLFDSFWRFFLDFSSRPEQQQITLQNTVMNSLWGGDLRDRHYPCVRVLDRCPSYRKSTKPSEERQGPTVGSRFGAVSAKGSWVKMKIKSFLHWRFFDAEFTFCSKL